MITRTMVVTMYAPQCHSLKEKRMIVKSIVTRVKNKFNVSIAEVDKQDFCKTIVLGIAAVSSSQAHTQEILDEVLRFIGNNADADIINAEFE